jgi:pimeloyl-ACP methyl ester carboxylesterase
VSHLDYFWAEPSFARFLQRLASFSRLILFDKRGTGLSDRVGELPTLEQRMDDVRAVLDACRKGGRSAPSTRPPTRSGRRR